MRSKLLARYDAFWMDECSGLRMALFRIAFALYLLVYLGALAPHVTVLFSNQGVYAPYLLPDLAPSPAVAHALFGAMLLACCTLLIGYRTELSAAVLLALYLHHYFLQLAVKQSAFERLIILYLAVLALAGAGQRLGFDGALTPGPRPRWGERVIAAQSIFLYAGSGLWKALNPAWHTGALLRSTFQGMWATPLGFALAGAGLPDAAWTAASFGVMALELGLAPLLLFRRTRLLGVGLAAAFHIGNWVLLFIPEFLICIAALVVFLDERALERLGARARALISTRAGAA